MSEAQKEAERRYPYPSDGPFSQVKSELNAARQSAFLSGVKWQSEQQATDAQVEAAARVLAELEPGEDWLAQHDSEVAAKALNDAADAWSQGAWGSAPRRAERAADRLAAAQFAGDWLRSRAKQQTKEGKHE